MSFESYRSKGRASTFLMIFVSVIAMFASVLFPNSELYISIIVLFVNFVTLFLLLVAMNGFAKYYDDSKIFKNTLYPVIIGFSSSIIYRILNYVFVAPTIEQSSISVSLQVFAILWVVTSVVAIINGIFYRRAFDTLAEKSGENNFKQAGSYIFSGGILTIVIVGVLFVFIGWILAFKGFSSMKPKTSQTLSDQETPPN